MIDEFMDTITDEQARDIADLLAFGLTSEQETHLHRLISQFTAMKGTR